MEALTVILVLRELVVILALPVFIYYCIKEWHDWGRYGLLILICVIALFIVFRNWLWVLGGLAILWFIISCW